MDRPVNVLMGLQGVRFSLAELSEIGVKRVSVGAWTVTLLVMLAFAGIVGWEVARAVRGFRMGLAGLDAVWEAVLPLLGVVGATSLLMALASTIGVFMRFRTASLADIQVRLAALETALTAEDPSDRDELV